MNLYCNDCSLKINVSKTKVVILSRGKIRKHPHFYLGDKLLEICSDCLYLGVKFNYNGKFSKAQQELFDKDNRAMFSILKISRQLNLPIDLQLHRFVKNQHTVGIFFYLEKAYDRTWKGGIMKDLHEMGLKGRLPLFIDNFLKGREFKVRLDNTHSSLNPQE